MNRRVRPRAPAGLKSPWLRFVPEAPGRTHLGLALRCPLPSWGGALRARIAGLLPQLRLRYQPGSWGRRATSSTEAGTKDAQLTFAESVSEGAGAGHRRWAQPRCPYL